MAVKLLSTTCSKKVPSWVRFPLCAFSISSASNAEIISETEQNLLNSSEFGEKINFLKNRLRPESLISILDSTHDLVSSLKLFKWASLQNRFRHTADTYLKMISKLGLAGNVDEMEGFCKEMVRERFPGTEETLVALIDLFVKSKRLSEASRVLSTLCLGNYKASIGVFNNVLGAMVERKGDFSEVLFVYKEMVKTGTSPNTDTLNYLLEALFDSDRVGIALDQYRRMSKKRCNPNSKTFEILISRLVEKDCVGDSLVVLNEMFGLHFEPDLSFYCCIIPLFCGLNKLEVGMKLFNMMKSSNLSPDCGVYEALVWCLCENQLLNDARDLVKEMKNCGLTPADDVLVEIVDCFCKLGKFVEAKSFLEDKDIWSSHPRNALLRGYCNIGNFLTAESLFINMLERDLADTDSWNILIRWLSENSGLSKALKFLNKMIVSSYVPDSATYSALIVGYCRDVKYNYALVLFHRICSKSWVLDSSSYAELVDCLCQNGRNRDAEQVYSYMSSKRCTLQLQSFNMLIKGICADGNIDGAMQLLVSAYYSNMSSSTETYNAIMLALLKTGKAKDLLVLLSRMLVEGCSLETETYVNLIEGMLSIGRTKDSVHFFNSMVDEGLLPNSERLCNVLSCYSNLSLLHTILVSLDKLIQNQESLNSEIFSTLIKGLWREGYRTVARRLLDVMLEKGWVPDATTHGLLMGSVSRKGEEGKFAEYEDIDSVSTILAEGLGKA